MGNKSKFATFVWLLVIYEIAIYLSMDAYVPALPDIAHIFGTTASLAQLTATAWMFGGFVVQLIFGPLSDRYGRRPILLWGGVLYVLSSVGCALSPNIDTMLTFRLLQGVAMPSMYIAGYAAINELFSTKEAVHKLALMNSVTILAPAFGPTLGGSLLLAVSWRWIFVILAVAAVVTIILLYFKMPETVSAQEKEKHKIHLGNIFRQYGRVFANYKFINSALITFLPVVGMIAWMLAGPFIVTQMFHGSTLDFGLIQVFIFGGFIVGTRVVKKFSQEKNYPLFINVGLGLGFLASVLAFFFSVYLPHSLIGIVIMIMVVSFSAGLSIPILSRLTLEASDASMGVRVTVFSVVRIGSGVLGSVAVVLFYNKTLLSMALIILTFSFIAVVLRLIGLFHEKNS